MTISSGTTPHCQIVCEEMCMQTGRLAAAVAEKRAAEISAEQLDQSEQHQDPSLACFFQRRLVVYFMSMSAPVASSMCRAGTRGRLHCFTQ